MIERREEFAITLMCRVLRVARAGFYEWLRETVSDRAKDLSSGWYTKPRAMGLIYPQLGAFLRAAVRLTLDPWSETMCRKSKHRH